MRLWVVRAAKYATVSIILVAAVPILIPLIVLLILLGFALVVPLGGTLAGFLYVQKYAGILYHTIPRAIGGHIDNGDITFSSLSHKDPQSIEVDDPEFDAVVVRTCPSEVSSNTANTWNETGSAVAPDITGQPLPIAEDIDSVADTFGEEDSVNTACSGCTSHARVLGEDEDSENLTDMSTHAKGGNVSIGTVAVRDADEAWEKSEEALSDNALQLGDVYEVQERDDVNPEAAKVIGSCSPVKDGDSDGASLLLPHQENEHDIWVCKDCGWKYPNAKPSAKIRRNHKKHCSKGHPFSAEFSEGPSGSPHNSASTNAIDATSMDFRDDLTEQSRVVGNDERTDSAVDAAGPVTENASDFDCMAKLSASASEEHGGNSIPASKSDPSISCEAVRRGEESFVPQSPRSAVVSDSFRSAPDDFTEGNSGESNRWSIASEVSTLDDQEDCRTRVQEVLQLQEDLNTVKEIVGFQESLTRPLVVDIEKLSDILGIDLPTLNGDVSEFEWAKVALEVMKVIVGVDQ